jgi:hypothetical protein
MKITTVFSIRTPRNLKINGSKDSYQEVAMDSPDTADEIILAVNHAQFTAQLGKAPTVEDIALAKSLIRAEAESISTKFNWSKQVNEAEEPFVFKQSGDTVVRCTIAKTRELSATRLDLERTKIAVNRYIALGQKS